MSEQVAAELARARQELAAARVLLGRAFHPQAVSRAYYAAFHTARAALLALGEAPKTHAGLVARFGEKVVVRGGFDPSLGRLLRRLLDERFDADYSLLDLSAGDAQADVEDAERFVEAVERWLAGRHP